MWWLNVISNFQCQFEFKFKCSKLAKEGLQSFSILHVISPKAQTWHSEMIHQLGHFKNATHWIQCHFKWVAVQIQFEFNSNDPTFASVKLVQTNFIKSELIQGLQLIFFQYFWSLGEFPIPFYPSCPILFGKIF